jgi:choline-glycine betaine transporter
LGVVWLPPLPYFSYRIDEHAHLSEAFAPGTSNRVGPIVRAVATVHSEALAATFSAAASLVAGRSLLHFLRHRLGHLR